MANYILNITKKVSATTADNIPKILNFKFKFKFKFYFAVVMRKKMFRILFKEKHTISN